MKLVPLGYLPLEGEACAREGGTQDFLELLALL